MPGEAIADGRYHLVRKLRAGGNGIVWLANHAAMGTDVVIKFPRRWTRSSERIDEQLEREIQTLVSFSSRHPHIVNILDVGNHAGSRFIVTQFMRNGSLHDVSLRARIAPAKNLTSHLQSLAWLSQISGALDFIHPAGLIHRDVKPANVLLDDSFAAYLADFGIAIDSESALHAVAEGKEQKDSLIGSLPYVAPELFVGRPASPASDQFALGVTMYEFALGAVPFSGRTGMEVWESQSKIFQRWEAEDSIPGVNRAASAVLRRALSPDPALRFGNCSQFASELIKCWQTPSSAALSETSCDTKHEASPTVRSTRPTIQPGKRGPRIPRPDEEQPRSSRRILPLRRLFDEDDFDEDSTNRPGSER
jgi:serine/threonine-protein kinase